MAGRKQPQPFDAQRAALLDDPERERWLPTARIVALLDVNGPMRILDYGTGTGRYALSIARSHPQARVVAFDIQQKMLDIVNDRVTESGLQNIRTAGPGSDALAGGTFDRALGVHLLHEIDDEHVEQIHHALKPGGSLLIVDWDRDAKRDFGPPPDHVHTLDEAMERLRRAGFTPEVLDSPDFPYHFAIRAMR
ncbi:MAG TPA: class I SAM-dependent methyltransferase [Candidatus Baltobacteraceae bacterium]|nr:class I SAM-dependent methyltransferase [Candidatus Baltobacteraceae bacterium]